MESLARKFSQNNETTYELFDNLGKAGSGNTRVGLSSVINSAPDNEERAVEYRYV